MNEELLTYKKELETLHRQLGNALTVRVNDHREAVEEKITKLAIAQGTKIEKEVAQHFQIILRQVVDLTQNVANYRINTERTIVRLTAEFRDKASKLDQALKHLEAKYMKALR